MENIEILFWISIGLIVTIFVTIFLVEAILIIRNEKPFEIHQNVCYMPRDCFDNQKDYLDQFPERYEPKYFRECLVYCDN